MTLPKYKSDFAAVDWPTSGARLLSQPSALPKKSSKIKKAFFAEQEKIPFINIVRKKGQSVTKFLKFFKKIKFSAVIFPKVQFAENNPYFVLILSSLETSSGPAANSTTAVVAA